MHDDEVTICGQGEACEAYCPVARIGRACPDVDEFYAEMAEAGFSLEGLASRLG